MEDWFSCSINSSSFWIRFLGYGISIYNKRKHPALFSERNGFVKYWYVLGYKIKLLKPYKNNIRQEETDGRDNQKTAGL